MPEGLSRGFRKITQAFGAAGGLRPSEGIARLGGGSKTVLPATQLQCRDRRAGVDAKLLTKLLDNLPVSWSDGVMAEGWRAVCGDVRNVGQVSARGVAIRVLGLGSASQVISTRDHYILADVPAGARAVFCVPMPAGATSYHVMVLRADWRSLEAP
jgi:hypothetical protein